MQSWALSSFGRALPWHGRGEGFDSPRVHNSILYRIYALL